MAARPLLLAALAAAASAQSVPLGTVQSAYDLLERVLPGSSPHFALTFTPACPGAASPHCFTLADAPGGGVAIAGTSSSQLTAAIGIYLRDYCNLTFGWARGGSPPFNFRTRRFSNSEASGGYPCVIP
jgi:hypothetical protein